MDQERQETIKTIFDLAQSVEPRLKGMHPDELKETIEREYRIDLTEDDEDKLDRLTETLVHRKKTMKPTSMAPVAPIKATPQPIRRDVLCPTNFQVGERIRHVNRPDWGEGDIVVVEVFELGNNPLQKLQILFNKAGRKFIIVQPGMLERIVPVANKAST